MVVRAMSTVHWSERDRWKIPVHIGQQTLFWGDAPGTVLFDCESDYVPDQPMPFPRQFWCVGHDGDRYWANQDGAARIFWFDSEREARDFVEVMLRMKVTSE